MVSVLLILIITVYTIIKVRERKQRQIQEYLQTALDERTKEVREQATEIENKNRDITDSINYAQRIQASILPPIGRLQGTFAGSFVFYQPRDIVSGDFYWYDTVWKDYPDKRYLLKTAGTITLRNSGNPGPGNSGCFESKC